MKNVITELHGRMMRPAPSGRVLRPSNPKPRLTMFTAAPLSVAMSLPRVTLATRYVLLPDRWVAIASPAKIACGLVLRGVELPEMPPVPE
jgi:hypothetical protein